MKNIPSIEQGSNIESNSTVEKMKVIEAKYKELESARLILQGSMSRLQNGAKETLEELAERNEQTVGDEVERSIIGALSAIKKIIELSKKIEDIDKQRGLLMEEMLTINQKYDEERAN